MPFVSATGLRYYQFESMSVRHAVFTRRGGTSPAPWTSLNVGGTVGDDTERVKQNRLKSFHALECAPESIFDVWQVHGIETAFGDQPRNLNDDSIKADIILTDNPQVTLFMRFADCVPLLFHDPVNKVIGIAHGGWMGTLQDVAGASIRSMEKRYGTQPSDVIACIGPSIGPDHYEVGNEVIDRALAVFEKEATSVLLQVGRSTHLDLWTANRILLERAGVSQIELSGICTACHPDDWYTYWLANGRTGRFGVLMSLT